jgi:hypothetical protein
VLLLAVVGPLVARFSEPLAERVFPAALPIDGAGESHSKDPTVSTRPTGGST